jgi:hypothetical protein
LTYIRTGSEFDDTFVKQAQDEASERSWTFEEFAGDLNLFRRALSGEWQSDFLVVPPGQVIAATYDEEIVRVDPQ